ncbi:probable ATP-dependent RNA helicase DDX56 [Anopheles ziemanni]|uniref:probable ATP-dependent RNA helicase DDX56 n=1 Tax=Anopheles coustani TaxID=139045 RepID=UPI002659FE15|nr:probable ATP-dependent RNA helicase DDX56 [Anopheles coustani]XP_058173266.1 probable ATP-dependent RNA helicase DDX56 [Anopheles ziemanni]
MEATDSKLNFHELELDERILKEIARLGWLEPTLVQEKAIPFLLEGKDVLIRARTGSGKTAAFAVPIIQNLLVRKGEDAVRETSVIVMAPSQDLCHQITKAFQELTFSCSTVVRVVDISSKEEQSTYRHMLAEHPDIVVSTPAKLRYVLSEGILNVRESLRAVVIDEADLMFSFGFEEDLREVLKNFPPVHQSVLCSATLDEDLITLKKMVLHNPVVLKLQEPNVAIGSQMTHYKVEAAEEVDKAAILFILLKLKLIQGKCLIFVKSVERCYRLKLFLEQFNIRACILNSELPIKIRCHTVSQFNKGLYDTIITSDETVAVNPAIKNKKRIKKTSAKRLLQASNAESGVSRGIDFQCVSCVVNFDFPSDVNSYIHRAGRTARGNNTGSVLSFVAPDEVDQKVEVESFIQGFVGDETFAFKNFQFNFADVEAFRYRALDAWRAITKLSIREARVKELKTEMLNSEKLTSFFEENPRDLQALRHDRSLHTVHIQEHLADVPEYLVPPALKAIIPSKKAHRNKRLTELKVNAQKRKAKLENPLLMDGLDYQKKRMV